MFSLTLLCVGRLKEKFYLDAAAEYQKRLRAYADFTLLELPEEKLPDAPSPAQITQALAREADAIRRKIPRGSWVCAFAIEGKPLSSEALAGTLARVKVTHPFATLTQEQAPGIPFDLHVLSTPPAFILSQNRTLHKKTFS